MKVGIISFTAQGGKLCRSLCALMKERGICCAGFLPGRFLTPEWEKEGLSGLSPGGLEGWTKDMFSKGWDMVFIGAAGIAVRAIAPWVKDKMRDPAVVVMDEAGQFAIPILSGHVGGANDLARLLGKLTGALPVITTATDVNQVFSVDVFAAENHLLICGRKEAKEVAAALLEGRQVGFFSDFPVMFWGNERVPPGCCPYRCSRNIRVTLRGPDDSEDLFLIPRVVAVGVGCRRGVPKELLKRKVEEALFRGQVDRRAVFCLASIDVKRDEPGLMELAGEMGWDFLTYSAEELRCVPGEFEESEFVRKVAGVGNVCERAAIKASGGRLILGKQAGEGVTVALGASSVELRAGRNGAKVHRWTEKKA